MMFRVHPGSLTINQSQHAVRLHACVVLGKPPGSRDGWLIGSNCAVLTFAVKSVKSVFVEEDGMNVDAMSAIRSRVLSRVCSGIRRCSPGAARRLADVGMYALEERGNEVLLQWQA